MKKAIISCCLYKRNYLLPSILNNLLKVKYPLNYDIEILFIDNDPRGGAKSIIQAFKSKSKIKVHYFNETKKGIVNARNRVLQESYNLKADFLLGFDDDDLISINWIKNLLKAQKEHNATAIRGETSRDGVLKEGSEAVCFSTNNFLIDLNFTKKHNIKFDMRFNDSGGEDTDFSTQMYLKGANIRITKKALIKEIKHDQKRNHLKEIIGRAYSQRVYDLKYKIKSNHSALNIAFDIVLKAILTPFVFVFKRKKYEKHINKIYLKLGKILALINIKTKLYKD